MAKCRFIYSVSPDTCPQDNKSQTAILELPILNCDDKSDFPKNCSDLFNANICEQDIEYFSPICTQEGRFGVTDAKYLFFQLGFFIPISERAKGWKLTDAQADWYIKVEIYNCCCELQAEILSESFIYKANTFRVDDLHYQNIEIDVTNLPDCFVFKFTTSDGKTAFSQAFKKDCCSGQAKLEGKNKEYDCEGRYYNLPENIDSGDNSLFYRNIVRFLAQPYMQSESITRNINKNTQLSVERTEKVSINTFAIPQYEVKNLISVLSSDDILLSGNGYSDNSYTFVGDISKNIETNNMWRLEFQLTRIDCNKQTKC